MKDNEKDRNKTRKTTKKPPKKTHKPNEEPSKEPNEEEQREESPQETGEEEEAPQETTEEEDEPQEEDADQETSEGPTDKEIKTWVKENPFECDVKGCDKGLGGRPYRCKNAGGKNLHKFNGHGIGERKEKKETPEGEDDMADEVEKRIDKVTLRGKINKAITRISKLPKAMRENLEVERSLLMDWKTRTFKKDVPVEELTRYESELQSYINPAVQEIEDEIKEEKAENKSKADKKSKRERDDDFDPMDDMNEQIRFSMMQDRLEAAEDRREQREIERRNRTRREEEEHKIRMEAMKRGGGGTGTLGGADQGGLVYAEEVTFRHDETGALVLVDGKPVPQSMKKTPIHPLMLLNPPAPKTDGGASPLFTMMKEANETARTEAKESRETTQSLIKALTEEKEKSRDTQIQGKINELTGAINNIAGKVDKDPLTEFMAMEEKLKEKNIFRGGESPEVKKIDLQIAQEKAHSDLMIKEFELGFGLINTMAGKLSDGVIAKSIARKIDEGVSPGEEEELPEDEALEEEMKEEVGKPRSKKKKKKAGEK